MAAQARNRPCGWPGYLLLVVLGVLLGLAARAAAAPAARDEADDTLSANHLDELAAAAGDGIDDDGIADDAIDAAASDAAAFEADALGADAFGVDALGAVAMDSIALDAGAGQGSSGAADAREWRDARLRPSGASRWGRLSLELVWQHRLSGEAADLSRRDQLWLLAVWSR